MDLKIPEIVMIDNVQTCDANIIFKNINRDGHIKTPFTKWIGRQLSGYGFIEHQDYWTILSRNKKKGRPSRKYYVTLNSIEHLCMIDKSHDAMKLRQKYIELRKTAENIKIARLVGIETRKSLTDKVKDSGENERMHGFAYSRYTTLAYELCGLSDLWKDYKLLKNRDIKFRNILSKDNLGRVETVEKLIQASLAMGKQYKEIKSSLKGFISFKEIKE